MNTKILKPAVFVLSFFVALALYWPAMKGEPIWDDFTFWFTDPAMKNTMPYSTIWANYAWPFSVSLQKFTLSLFHKKYLYYHLLSFCIHFANAILVYRLGRLFRFKHPIIFFLLFLLHPVAVITTAWMIQIKTLLCMFFGLAALLTFMKGNKDYRWMIASWVLFLLSITSKSASLTLPLIFLAISFRSYRFQKLHLLIPFFVLAGLSAYKVLKSPVTQAGAVKAAHVNKIKAEPVTAVTAPVVKKEIPAPEVKPEIKPEVKVEPKKVTEIKAPKTRKAKKEKVTEKVEASKTEVVPQPVKEKKLIRPKSPVVNNEEMKTNFKFIALDIGLISQTLHYYFWQVFLPNHNEPVKGLNPFHPGIEEILHIIFLILLIATLWKDSALKYLAASHFLLLPFLGIIPAPFMNVTWVSDQHLYLVLPAMLAFWIRLVDKINWKYSFILPSFFVLFFSYKTLKATPIYKNQYSFYEASLDYNPFNVPIAYNLAFARLLSGDIEKAYYVVSDAYNRSLHEPIMRKNIYYPHLLQLYVQLKLSMDKSEN